MIDWLDLARGALGVAGLAIILATLSYRRYVRAQRPQASEAGGSADRHGAPDLLVDAGLLLVALSVALGPGAWWQRALAGAGAALLAALHGWAVVRRARPGGPEPQEGSLTGEDTG